MRFFLLSFLLCFAACQKQTPLTEEKKPYTIEQFMKNKGFAGASFSPDESKLLLTALIENTSDAYRISLETKELEQLTQFSHQSIKTLSYFPHDERFLFSKDTDGDEKGHLFVFDQGQLLDITPNEGAKHSFFGWEGNKEGFYYLSNERDPTVLDLYRVDATTYETTRLYTNTGGHRFGPIAFDGSFLILQKDHSEYNNDLYLYSFEEETLKHLTPHEGLVTYSAEDLSNDGKTLYFLTNKDHDFSYAKTLDLESGKEEILCMENWDVEGVYLSEKERYLITLLNENAQAALRIFDQKAQKELKLPKELGDISTITISPSETKLALYSSSSKVPRDLFLFDIETETLEPLTHSLNPEIDPNDLVEGERVTYPSFDNLSIPAILYRPHTASEKNPVPAIVYVHGGPGGQSRMTYNSQFQFLANHGIAILAVNNRGSSGYGYTFYQAADRKHGDYDLKDCIYGKHYLESLPWVEKGAVSIMGGSYGGYMVLAALTFTPEEFCCGVDLFGVANWVRTMESLPPWWEVAKEKLYERIGHPVHDRDYLIKISPLFHTEAIQKPLLVIQGANDPRVLQQESDDIVAKLQEQKIPCEYLLFPDEGHGFSKRSNAALATKNILRFLQNYGRPNSLGAP